MKTNTKFIILSLTIKYNLSAWDNRLLCEWLDCYDYVLPKDRSLKILPIINMSCARDVFNMWRLCDIIESTFTASEQLNAGINCLCKVELL